MTSPHDPRLVCPPSLPIDVEMIFKVPKIPLVDFDNDAVEALKSGLVECMLDYK